MTYFKNIRTLEELRKEYKRLVKENHPDNGGDLEIIKMINVEYEKAMESLKNADETENAWKYDVAKDELFRDTLNKVINLENVKIEIIGCWIWISGNTYEVKDVLKAAGFKWCANKKAWSWHAGEKYYKKSKRKLTLDEIRNLYGSEEVEPNRKKQIRKDK